MAHLKPRYANNFQERYQAEIEEANRRVRILENRRRLLERQAA